MYLDCKIFVDVFVVGWIDFVFGYYEEMVVDVFGIEDFDWFFDDYVVIVSVVYLEICWWLMFD